MAIKDYKSDSIDLKIFPTTRYQGSKRKIIPWIFEIIKNIEFDSVLDIFGGTSSASYLFKKMGKEVIYNDILKFNHIIGLALIENNNTTLSQDEIKALIIPAKNQSQGFISKTFKNIYYTNAENSWLDVTIDRILNMGDRGTWEYKKSIAYYALFQSCLIKRPFNLFHRRNLSIRMKNVKRSFGNKTTWDQPFEFFFEKFSHEANSAVFDSGKKCRSINYNALDIPEKDYDLIYIDSPYLTKNNYNETANYIRCYHFLEGLANFEIWKELIDYNTNNYQFKKNGENIWINPKKNESAFEELIEKFPRSKIIISYKKYGSPSIQKLIKILRRHRSKVEWFSRPYSYALNNQNGNANRNREVLLIGK